jgi:hypothetical protein
MIIHINSLYKNTKVIAQYYLIAPQKSNYSNISEGIYNNWYLQTYNWNRWTPINIPNEFMDQFKVQEMKDKNEHHKFYYVS